MRQTERWSLVVALALVLFGTGAGAAAGQAAPTPLSIDGRVFRTTVGMSYLIPLGDNSAPVERLPSARVTLSHQISPRVAFNVAGMRLALDRPGPTPILPAEQDAIWAALMGFRVNLTTGRFRVGPFLEGGGGQLDAQIDSGTALWHARTPVFGGVGGLGAEIIVGPGATLELAGGYLHFMTPGESVAPITGPYATAGLRWAFRDESWYWRTSGRDVAGPLVVLVAPQADSTGRVHVGQSSTQLRFAVSDAAGVVSLSVANSPVRLVPAPRELRPEGMEGDWKLGDAVLPLESGENRIAVVARDAAGNRTVREWVVMGVPDEPVVAQPPLVAQADTAPPEPRVVVDTVVAAPGLALGAPQPSSSAYIDILEPTEWGGRETRGIQAVQRTSIRVRGTVAYAGRIGSVRINRAEASLQLDADGRRGTFFGYVPVSADMRQVEIEAFTPEGRPVGLKVVELTSVPSPDSPTLHARQPIDSFEGRRWAVIIGISEYQDPMIRDLRFADDDAIAFHDFLRSPAAGLGGIPEENMRLLVNEEATYLNIRLALRDFLASATDEDIIIFYVAAHGIPDRRNEYYLVAHDTPADQLSGLGVPLREVTEGLERAYGQMKIAFIDACHAGGIGERNTRGVDANQANEMFLEAMRSATGGWVNFVAAEANQTSEEGEEWGGGHGVFTYSLLQGLEGHADHNGDRVVDLGELLDYTRERVRRETANAQIPNYSQSTFDRHWPMSLNLLTSQ